MVWRLIMKFILLFALIALADCSNEGILAVECPFLCECAGFEVTCVGTDVFPAGISEKVKQFYLVNSSVDNIPINAFKDFPALTEVRISGTKLRTIRACSFAELENMTSLSFDDVTVDVVEGNAFSNLKNITRIEFRSSKIGALRSYSFHNIAGVDKVIFSGTEVSVIHPFTFLNFKNVSEIEIENSVIDRFLADGISRIQKVNTFILKNSHVREWHCGTLSILAENNVQLEISETSIQCDCKSSWLFEQFSNTSIFAAEQRNICNRTGNSLAETSLDEICTETSEREKCHRPLPSTPHTCSRSFDEPFNPEGKVEYPSYFTKAPRAVASGSHVHMGLPIVGMFLSLSMLMTNEAW